MFYQKIVITILLLVPFPGYSQSNNSSLSFIENKGQWDTNYDFGSWFSGGKLLVNSSGFIITLFDAEAIGNYHLMSHGLISESDERYVCNDNIQGHNLQLSFAGSNPHSKFIAKQKKSAYYNFFLGKDKSNWVSKAFAYETLLYSEIYEGIDLQISSVNKNLKYDFIIEPCGDPNQIIIEYKGSDLIGLENGDLMIQTSLGRVVEMKPIAFQIRGEQKINVPVLYQIENQKVKFDFPEGYDDSMGLIIDPLLIFSTYSGSMADNWGSSATPGEKGTLYSSGVTNHFVGSTFSGTFPATPGAFQTTYGGIYDVSILKYDSLGQNLLYASYLGGSDNDSPHSLIMDKDENLIVFGTTGSIDFPTTFGVISQNYSGGSVFGNDVINYNNGSDIFIAKISKDGSTLIKSTYLGGGGNDGLNNTGGPLTKNYGDENRGDIITDDAGNIYISSVTWSPNFPVVNSFSTSFHGGGTDAIVAKISPDLSTVVWAGYLGGSGYDASHTIKINQEGNIVVAGGTTSTDFPVSAGAYQSSYRGSADGWISVISSDGLNILNSTYTGSANFDQVYIIDLNEDDEVYLFGQTTGNIPVTPGRYSNPNSGQFVQKLSADLSTLIWSTVVGSGTQIPNISPTAFLVNDCNNLFLAGWGGLVNSSRFGWDSDTRGLPISADAFQKNTQGSDFYFMVLNEEATQFLYGTYLGGTSSSVHVDGGTSRFDKRGIVYHAVCSGCFTASSDFPTTPGAYSATNNSINCNNAAFKFDLSLLKAQFRTNTLDFKSPNVSALCYPNAIVFENLSIGGEIFEWDLGDGTQIFKTDTTAIAHQYQQPGSYKVQLKSVDQNTCIGVDSVTKIINIYGRDSQVQEDDEICYNTEYQLMASGGIAYSWSDQTGAIFSNQANPVVMLTQTGQFYVDILESTGCFYSDTVTIEVLEPIIPDFDLIMKNNCFERPVIELIDKSVYSVGDTVYFDFGDGQTSDLDQVTHSYDQDGFYTVKAIGKGKLCSYEKIIQVPIFTLSVPNVITPGIEDGKNDYLLVQFGDGSETANAIGLQASLTVINRWGKVVFETNNYQNNWKAENSPAGVYYFVVVMDGYAECTGWVEVIK
jgi:hypothetical protein